MNTILPNSFFDRDTEQVARELLGKTLVRKIGSKTNSYMITEVEAYLGPHDLASHSSKGKSPRNTSMYMGPGTIYVYLWSSLHA